MALIETYLTLSIVSTIVRLPHILGLDTVLLTYDSTIKELERSHINLAVAVNSIFTLLLLFGKFIQYLFFGKLREIEERNFRERFFLYVVTKFFIFAVKDHEVGSIIMWGFWFSIQCFLKLFSLLSRDRFEYLNTFSPNTHAKIHFKLLFLLVSILMSDLMCFYFSTTIFYDNGLSNIMILNFEFFTIFFETIQTLIKYSIHLFDMAATGVWEQRGAYIYYTEFATDSIILAGTCFHLIHIVIIQGMPTLLDLVLFSYFKGVFTELKRKIIGYRNYCKLVEDMDTKYLNATEEELIIYNDDCAICRDRMDTAKKLPCGHIFHHSCLRSWLEQQTSCPTCRRSLIEIQNESGQPNGSSSGSSGASGNSNSSNYTVNPTDIDRIHELFPHIPRQSIYDDLLQTHDVNETTNNILEGRLILPSSSQPQSSTTGPTISTPNNSSSSSINDNQSNLTFQNQIGQPLPNDGNGIVSHHQNITSINNNSSSNDIISSSSSSSSSSNSSNSLNQTNTTTTSLNESQSNNKCTDNSNNNNNNNNSNSDHNQNAINNSTSDNNNNNFSIKKLDKFSDQFQGTPEARQNSLLLRKRLMLEASRKKFLEEMERSNNSNNITENSTPSNSTKE